MVPPTLKGSAAFDERLREVGVVGGQSDPARGLPSEREGLVDLAGEIGGGFFGIQGKEAGRFDEDDFVFHGASGLSVK